MKNINLRKNLQEKSNINNFSNDRIDPEKKSKRKNLLLISDKEKIDEFKIVAFEFYRKNNILSLFAWSHFFPIAVKNIRTTYEKKYKKLLVPDSQYLKFYQTKSKASNARDFYNLDNMERITFVVDPYYLDLYHSLMHTFYINERTNLTSFSVSLYFSDFVQELKNIDINYYEN